MIRIIRIKTYLPDFHTELEKQLLLFLQTYKNNHLTARKIVIMTSAGISYMSIIYQLSVKISITMRGIVFNFFFFKDFRHRWDKLNQNSFLLLTCLSAGKQKLYYMIFN